LVSLGLIAPIVVSYRKIKKVRNNLFKWNKFVYIIDD
jgi:hypothetical protein